MKVGFYSPLPPARTGVADYAATLLEALRRLGPVEIAPERCEAPIYHLGNNRLHAEIYSRALSRPGVVVLHDAVLHHFLLGQLDEAAYLDEFAYNYGEWNRSLARALWRGRPSSGTDSRYFDYPMLKRVASAARAVVVHNPAAAAAVRAHAPGTPVVEIPHLFRPPELPGAAEATRFRQRAGISPGAFLFGVFGFLRESKRLAAVLAAFAELRRERPECALLVAGDFVSSDLERALRPQLAAPGVTRLPYLEEREFWLAASAVDACVNLRYPAAGETSGIAIRMMGIGKPVLLTDSLECSGYPEDACLRVAAGVAERDSLLCHMHLLTSMSEAARAIGRQGARHVRACHSVEAAAKRYWDTLCEFRS